MINLYGTPSITLTEALDNLLALQGNDKQVHYIHNLIAAKWGWKELMLTTIWSVKQVYLPIDEANCTAQLPKDFKTDRLLTISIVDDCGNIQPLTYNPDMKNLRLQVPVQCGCSTCGGDGTLCSYVDNITMRSSTVIINGQAYTKRVYNRFEANGTLYEVVEQPVYDTDTETVITQTFNSIVCALETTPEGCIANTPHNLELLVNNCGCFVPAFHRRMCDTVIERLPNKTGYWKQDALNSSIIHLQHYKHHYSNPKYLLVAYQTDGTYEAMGGEIMIPEFAIKAFFDATTYYRDQWKPNTVVSPAQKEYNKQVFNRSKHDLMAYMNPVIMEDFARLSSMFPKWGGLDEMWRHNYGSFGFNRLVNI